MTFEIGVTEIASVVYTVTAENEDEARAKLLRGEYDAWRDLGHEDLEIVEVRSV